MQLTCVYNEASALVTVTDVLPVPREMYLPNADFLSPPQWRAWLAHFCRRTADLAGVPRDRSFLVTAVARAVEQVQ